MNYELPLDVDAGDELDGQFAKLDAVLDEQFLREVDDALERLAQKRTDELLRPLAG